MSKLEYITIDVLLVVICFRPWKFDEEYFHLENVHALLFDPNIPTNEQEADECELELPLSPVEVAAMTLIGSSKILNFIYPGQWCI